MAGHELITAQLELLAARLPADAVDELADGLWQAYETRLGLDGDPERAARAAIAEFGDADTVTAAFLRESPWRRAALTLLATGPVMALVWGAALLTLDVRTWPIPLAVKLGYGLALLAVAATLLLVARARLAYRPARPAVVAAAFGLLVLDLSMLAAVTHLTEAPPWPVAPAVLAGLGRILLTVRTLPAILRRGA
ncbi:hypothetical protein [Nonomuraea sp. NPDC048916]|uniref:hypothetical protein n=1 Tax=Nonomuraea sp. NPDC048916 TaxID=3154232 RepID=UPI0033CD6650